MNAVIRLDDKGSPYLIVYYEDREGEELNASDDAERLFFTKLNQNGGLLSLVPGKGKAMRMLVTTGTIKRRASVTESIILGDPEPRGTPNPEYREEGQHGEESFRKGAKGYAAYPKEEVEKHDAKQEELNKVVEEVEKEFDAYHKGQTSALSGEVEGVSGTTPA